MSDGRKCFNIRFVSVLFHIVCRACLIFVYRFGDTNGFFLNVLGNGIANNIQYIRTLSYSHEQTDYHNRIIIISAKVFVWANELRGRAGGYYTMYLSE